MDIADIISRLEVITDNIEFEEINTSEGDLEDVFIKVVSKNDATI